VASSETVVRFPATRPVDPEITAVGSCPHCGEPVAIRSRRTEADEVTVRLPDGLDRVLARTGEVTRRARAEREAERARITKLATYLAEQVTLFVDAMNKAGAKPTACVRIGGRVRHNDVPAWAVRHWRHEIRLVGSLPGMRHLYVAPDGRLYESGDDPGIAAVHGRSAVSAPVQLPQLLFDMGELGSRHAIERVIEGLAEIMKQAGATV
jgi:hypothetical protein